MLLKIHCLIHESHAKFHLKTKGAKRLLPKPTVLLNILHGIVESGEKFFLNLVTSMHDKITYILSLNTMYMKSSMSVICLVSQSKFFFF